MTLSISNNPLALSYVPQYRNTSFPQDLLRLSVFKFGALSKAPLPSSSNLFVRVYYFGVRFFSSIKQKILWFWLNRFQNQFIGKCFCSSKENFDVSRAERSKNILQGLGGEISYIVPQDQEGCIEVMMIKVADVANKISSMGGEWKKIQKNYVIFPPEELTNEWNEYYQQVLSQMGWKEEIIEEKKCLITATNMEIDNDFAQASSKCVLYPQLAVPYSNERRKIGYFLGKGLDVCAYDSRGVLESKGFSSEEGRYADADAVGRYLFEEQKYLPQNAWVIGTCGDTFVGSYLFKKYHQEGLNLFFENPPLNYKKFVEKQNWIVRIFERIFRKGIHAPGHSRLLELFPGDDFDTQGKMESLDWSLGSGKVILTKTIGDRLTPTDEVDQLGTIISRSGAEVTILENDPHIERIGGKQSKNPHVRPAYLNPDLQRDINKILLRE